MQAKQQTKAEWHLGFKKWSAWQARKEARREIKISESRALKEALHEDFQAELKVDGQVRNIRILPGMKNGKAP